MQTQGSPAGSPTLAEGSAEGDSSLTTTTSGLPIAPVYGMATRHLNLYRRRRKEFDQGINCGCNHG